MCSPSTPRSIPTALWPIPESTGLAAFSALSRSTSMPLHQHGVQRPNHFPHYSLYHDIHQSRIPHRKTVIDAQPHCCLAQQSFLEMHSVIVEQCPWWSIKNAPLDHFPHRKIRRIHLSRHQPKKSAEVVLQDYDVIVVKSGVQR